MSNNIDTRLLDREEKETLANLLWRYYYEKRMLEALPDRRYRYERTSYEDERKEKDRRIASIGDAFSTIMYELDIEGVAVGDAVMQKEKTL